MNKNSFTICLWFGNQAEEALKFFTSIFADSKIGKTQRYDQEGFKFHQRPAGSVMTIDFITNGLLSRRTMNTMFKMKKYDIATLQQAYKRA